MGRPTRPTEAYRDDPDAVSLHTQSEFDYDDAPEISGMPPAYTDDATAVPRRPPRHMPPTASPGNTDTTQLVLGKPVNVVKGVQTLVGDSRYDTDPVYLEEGIREFANIAPTPMILIMGSHTETVKRGDKKEKNHITDFKILLNLEQYLRNNFDMDDTTWMDLRTVENGQKAYRGGFMKSRAPGFKQDLEVGIPKPELREWCHRYCASPSKLRM